MFTMEKKILTTTTTTNIATDYNLQFLAIFINIFFATTWPNIIGKFVPRLKSFLHSKFLLDSSKIRAEKCLASPELSHNDEAKGFHDDHEDLEREDVEMVMERLGFFCSPKMKSKSEGLGESFGCDEFSRLFDEEEPSLEEVKEAFDVFDANRDGFIDAKELQRVLRLLGLKQRTEIEDCERMISAADENRNGRVDFNEFVKFMENILC